MTRFVIAEEPVDSPAVRWCFGQYAKELGQILGYRVDDALPLGLDEVTPPRGLVLIARADGEAVGCGAVKLRQAGSAEIKRMWVAPRVRGRGLGRRLLEALEMRAVEAGKSVARLDSNERLEGALAMYRSAGYQDVEPFNDDPLATHWLEKDLSRPPAAPRSRNPNGRAASTR